MFYGLVLIWVTRHAKRIVRKTGELMKAYGRKLEHLGDDITPRWGRKLFNKCYLADAEIHIGSNIFVGVIDTIYQENSGKDSLLVVRLKNGTQRNGATAESEISECSEFKLLGYGPPVIIKEAGCDCVWTGHKNGYLAIFFN
ncbi:MAG TPA: hypothetical protein DCS23_03480 [Candidatus Yonathbacteria bacterium]|nr:hypothetical protein [Candidatus Yonathbacteria bacterium]